MDIKKWLEDGTGLKFKELRTLKVTTVPYNIFLDDKRIRGSDSFNNIVEHNVTLEHYNYNLDDPEEQKIESFLNKNQKQFEKNREWLQDEKLFVTVFELDTFLEKIRKDDDKNAKKN